MELIDKDKVDEILRNLWKEDDGHNSEHRICYNKALQEVQCEIDSIEVKEADFDKEYEEFVEEDPVYNKLVNSIVGKAIAKHFFELGLKERIK